MSVCLCVCVCVRHRTPQKLQGLEPQNFAHRCVLYPTRFLSIFRSHNPSRFFLIDFFVCYILLWNPTYFPDGPVFNA